MDYLVKYDNNSKNKKSLREGLNVFSKLTITKLLKKNKQLKSFNLSKLNFLKI